MKTKKSKTKTIKKQRLIAIGDRIQLTKDFPFSLLLLVSLFFVTP